MLSIIIIDVLMTMGGTYLLGLLTGRPEEEVSTYDGNLLKELSKTYEKARKAMKSMEKALWPSDAPPDSMAELASRFKGARQRFELWKISACREGARKAWAMAKTWFTKLDPMHMARVSPVGPDGQEIPLSLVYEEVMQAARYSQKDCALEQLIDNVENE
jgi:hypothetical protein